MLVRSLNLTPGVEEWQKPPEASPDVSRQRASVPHAMASPLNGVSPHTVGVREGDARLN